MTDTKQATTEMVCECVGGFVERDEGTGIWRNHCAVCGRKRAKSCSCGTGDACNICAGSTQSSQELRIPEDLKKYYGNPSYEIAMFNEGDDVEACGELCLDTLIERIARLEGAIRWANGEVDEFPERKPGEGAYWWRKELTRRARLEGGR